MRFLKTKIAQARACATRQSELHKPNTRSRHKKSDDFSNHTTPNTSNTSTESSPILSKTSYQLLSSTPKGATSYKNIMKNYSRVLVKFALSKFAVPYLTEIFEGDTELVQEFMKFVREKRAEINCIKNLKWLLVVDDERDSDKLKVIKDAFKQVSTIFLKYFSVNWIFNSRVSDKLAHLKYRFKMLRRIQSNTYFNNLSPNDHV